MGNPGNADFACKVCGSREDVTYAIVCREPVTREDALSKDAYPFCTDHLKKMVEGDEYFVRELAPIPEERGGFSRTADEDGDILYDREQGDGGWIKFDPDSDEIELTEFFAEKED